MSTFIFLLEKVYFSNINYYWVLVQNVFVYTQELEVNMWSGNSQTSESPSMQIN